MATPTLTRPPQIEAGTPPPSPQPEMPFMPEPQAEVVAVPEQSYANAKYTELADMARAAHQNGDVSTVNEIWGHINTKLDRMLDINHNTPKANAFVENLRADLMDRSVNEPPVVVTPETVVKEPRKGVISRIRGYKQGRANNRAAAAAEAEADVEPEDAAVEPEVTTPEAAPSAEYDKLTADLDKARTAYVKAAASYTRSSLIDKNGSGKMKQLRADYLKLAGSVLTLKETDEQYIEQSGDDVAAALKTDAVMEGIALSQAVTAEQLAASERKNPRLKNFYQKWANLGSGSTFRERIKGNMIKSAIVLAPVGVVAAGAAALVLPAVGAGVISTAVGVALTRSVGRNLVGAKISQKADAPRIAEEQGNLRQQKIEAMSQVETDRTAVQELDAITKVTHESITKANKRNIKRDLGSLLLSATVGGTIASLVDTGNGPRFNAVNKLPQPITDTISGQDTTPDVVVAAPSVVESVDPSPGQYGNGIAISLEPKVNVAPEVSAVEPVVTAPVTVQKDVPRSNGFGATTGSIETPAVPPAAPVEVQSETLSVPAPVQSETLTVAAGDGFEDSIQKQYGLTDAQSSQVYQAANESLQGATGTYAINGDPSNIGINSAGQFQMPEAARRAIEQALEDLEEDAA